MVDISKQPPKESSNSNRDKLACSGRKFQVQSQADVELKPRPHRRLSRGTENEEEVQREEIKRTEKNLKRHTRRGNKEAYTERK